MLVSVMDALKAHDCISSYVIEGDDARPVWVERGFERALEELETNPKPFGLKKKDERAWLSLVLAQKDKKADDFLIGRFKERYGV